MKRFILTGAPGAGKTAILRQLERDGFDVVEEAATDVIALEMAQGVAEPHLRPEFAEVIADLQRRRMERAATAQGAVQFHDRSVVCTLALARHLGHPVGEMLARELRRIDAEAVFERRVLFVRGLGFITPTPARRINLEEALRFEATHEAVYRERGFDLVEVAPAPLAERVMQINEIVRALR
jgi:predicted ATPase